MREKAIKLSQYSSVGLLFTAFLLSTAAGLRSARAQQIAITFDDLPAHSTLPPGESRMHVAQEVIEALREAGAPPTYGFVNGVRIAENAADASVLVAWRAAGNPLGNHTWSHMNLDQHTVAEFEADVLRNEPVISERMNGADWHWLRFPFLGEGDTPEKRDAVRTFLTQHGYKIAAVTMSFGDFLWNEPYARCSAKGDKAAITKLEQSYLQAASDDADYRRAMARELQGHDIPYVLLMHIGAFDARMLPRLLALYQKKGFRFVALEKAEGDPFYANDLDLHLSGEPDTLEGAMAARGLAAPKHSASVAPAGDLCR